MRDIVVIGAGPAGSTAAERLAAAGYDVVVLEEHCEIGRPVHCTGLLGDDAFAEFQLPDSLRLARAEAARFWGAAGRSVQMQSGAVRASIIDRASLDEFLVRRAAAAGAEVITNCRAESVDVEPARVRIGLRGGCAPVFARACVLACGANYRFHRALQLGLPKAFLQSAQVDVPFAERHDIEVRFGRLVAPGGFAWLVPFNVAGGSRARIGLMSESRARDRFADFVRDLRQETGAAPEACAAEPRLKILPLAPIDRSFSDRVVAVGDAAGLVKPTTGGGIYYGMLSGAMAAETLTARLRENKLTASALAEYERSWRRRLGQEIKSGLRFRSIMAALSDESIDALIDLANVNGVVPLLQRTASFNWHRKAAAALLGHPAFRAIALKTLTGSDRSIQ